MKKVKRTFAVLFALVMALSVCAAAFADDTAATKGSITVKNAASTATYTAYKIFDETVSGEGEDKSCAFTIASSSQWLDTVIKYIGGYTKVGGTWYASTDVEDGTVNIDAKEATTFSSTEKGLTLKLSARGDTYIVTVSDAFSAADFAEHLYAALYGYEEVDTATVTKPADETTYYTHVGGQYVECEELTTFESGVTYYTKGTGLSVTGTGLTYNENTKEAKAINLDLGYYFVTSSVGSLASLTSAEPDAVIYDKNEVPPFDKTVDDHDVEIGQTVNYTVTGEVPSTVGYTQYVYRVWDNLSDGLTFKKSVTVKFGETEVQLTVVTAAVNEEVTTYTIGEAKEDGSGDGDSDGGDEGESSSPLKVYSKTVDEVTTYYSDETCSTKLENQYLPFGDSTIIYNEKGFVLYFDMTEHQDDVGDKITVTYSATVNENAVKGVEGNPNDAWLLYSNDPGDLTSTGEEEDVEKVYTVELTIDKYKENTENENDTSKKLAGAEFVLLKKGEEETFYQAVYAYTYTDSENNTVTVYSANGSSYYSDAGMQTEATLTEGTTLTKGKVVEVNWVEDIKNATTAVTGAEGKASFEGIEAGLVTTENTPGALYYLREIEAPGGYNLLDGDVTVEIKRTETETEGAVTVAISGYTVEVANKAGTALPSTGGVGTTIFYVVGSVLVLGSAILLVVKKRMKGRE